MYNTLTGSEFRDKIAAHDIQCVLAQLIAEEQLGSHTNLANAKDFMRHKYLEQASHVIEKFAKHGLEIVHVDNTD